MDQNWNLVWHRNVESLGGLRQGDQKCVLSGIIPRNGECSAFSYCFKKCVGKSQLYRDRATERHFKRFYSVIRIKGEA